MIIVLLNGYLAFAGPCAEARGLELTSGFSMREPGAGTRKVIENKLAEIKRLA
jgi:hypothetical protein